MIKTTDLLKPIIKKRRSISLFREGYFGNTLRTWSADEFIATRPRGLFSIRTVLDGGNGVCETDQTGDQVIDYINSSDDVSNLFFHESINNNNMVVQGYLLDNYGEYIFDYSQLKVPMREALEKDSRSIRSPMLPIILEDMMTDEASINFRNVIDMWPLHVYEITILNTPFGLSKNNNTMIWEVRQY